MHSWEGVKDKVSGIHRKTIVYNKELFPQSAGIWGEREEGIEREREKGKEGERRGKRGRERGRERKGKRGEGIIGLELVKSKSR